MSKDTGGPALPTPHYTNANGEVQWGADGMSLRDYFAAKAMAAQIVAIGGLDNGNNNLALELAVCSYAVAEAMLKARETK